MNNQLKEYHDSIYKGSLDFDTMDEEYHEALEKTMGFAFYRLGESFRKLFYAVKDDLYKLFRLK